MTHWTRCIGLALLLFIILYLVSCNVLGMLGYMGKGANMLKEGTREQDKEEIRNLFCGGDTLYYSDIVERLGINLRTVVEICDELEATGEIAIDKNI